MTATKFWAALIMVVANAVRSRFHLDLGIDGQLANDIAGGLIAGAVYLIPNKPKAQHVDDQSIRGV